MTEALRPTEQMLDRMKHLLALSVDDNGASENEREMAQERLDILLDQFNMTVDDLMGKETLIWVSLPVKTHYERQLALQVTAYVTGKGMVTYLKEQGRAFRAKCTEAQGVEIKRIYAELRPLFNREIELTVQAFFQAHHLFSGEEHESEVEVAVTEEMIERWRKLSRRTKEIETVSLRKRLDEGSSR